MKDLLRCMQIIFIFTILLVTTFSCEEKQTKKQTSEDVEFLLVQNADSVLMNDGKLRLKNIAMTTLYFSDRPDRIAGRVPTQNYVDHWSVGDNNFKSDPPNAVICVLHGKEVEDITVVLTEPKLEGADLLYNVEVLDGSTSINGGAVALFIDVVGRPATPLSAGGVHRRTRRKVAVAN